MSYLYDGNSDGTYETISGTVYVSQALWDNTGADPAHIVAQHLTEILENQYSSHPYQVYVMDERSESPNIDVEDVECDGDTTGAMDEWQDQISNAPLVLDDFNLLITNEYYNSSIDDNVVGCGELGGNVCVSEGGPNIPGETVQQFHYETDSSEAIQTAIHEVGHNLGMQHKVGDRSFEDRMSDSGDEYVISPLPPGANEENVCGAPIASNDGSTVVLDMRYFYCALENDYF